MIKYARTVQLIVATSVTNQNLFISALRNGTVTIACSVTYALGSLSVVRASLYCFFIDTGIFFISATTVFGADTAFAIMNLISLNLPVTSDTTSVIKNVSKITLKNTIAQYSGASFIYSVNSLLKISSINTSPQIFLL